MTLFFSVGGAELTGSQIQMNANVTRCLLCVNWQLFALYLSQSFKFDKVIRQYLSEVWGKLFSP